MRDPVHYLVEQKTRELGLAIATGWQARTVPSTRATLERGALHLIGGLQYGSMELLHEARETGEPYVFFDRAYFGGGPASGRLRVVPNAYQHHRLNAAPGGMNRLGQVWNEGIAPWKTGGRHLLVIPPSAAICRLFHLGDWEARILAQLNAVTDRPVRVSYKGDPVPLAERLRDCHAVIAFTSNVAVEAVMAGVPAFCSVLAAAAPVCRPLEDIAVHLEQPVRPEREAWAEGLAWGQWTIDEIRSGAARCALEGVAA